MIDQRYSFAPGRKGSCKSRIRNKAVLRSRKQPSFMLAALFTNFFNRGVKNACVILKQLVNEQGQMKKWGKLRIAMIEIRNEQLFHLYNEKISYIINVLPNQQLGHVYFGPSLGTLAPFDQAYLEKKRINRQEPSSF